MAGRKKGENKQTERIFGMVDALRAHRFGMEIDELASRFDVSARQVRRDLEWLKGEGYELDDSQGKAGKKKIVLLEEPLKPVNITISERFALMAVRRGHTDLAVGNVVGSNIFNILLVMGATGIVRPVPAPPGSLFALLMMALLTILLIPMSYTKKVRLRKHWQRR